MPRRRAPKYGCSRRDPQTASRPSLGTSWRCRTGLGTPCRAARLVRHRAEGHEGDRAASPIREGILTFMTHPWGGQVESRYRGHRHFVDLYSPEADAPGERRNACDSSPPLAGSDGGDPDPVRAPLPLPGFQDRRTPRQATALVGRAS